jgi:LacI family transcriptional regulator
MSKRVSLKDIAVKVGVSTALVSYVMNGLEKEKRVGPDIVKKIKEVAAQLNYKPNQIARSLRKGTTNTIGLIVADIANPFFGQLARIIEDEAGNHNYTVIIGSSDENHSKSASLIDTFLDRQVDGFIIVPSEGCEKEIKALVEKEVPVVLVDRYLPEVSTSYIVLNNYKATYEAVNHFLARGYKQIALIVYKSALIHIQERIRGYREAMIDNHNTANIQIKELVYNRVKEDMEKGISELFVGNQKPDALLFATNTLTISGMYAINNHNIKVPQEMALIGFDGNEAFDFFYSPLTFIEQPIEEMGSESVRILLDQIKGLKNIQHIELQHHLIQRASCG